MGQWKSAAHDGDLQPPGLVRQDPEAVEVVRAWNTRDGFVCALRMEAFKDDVAWGLALADILRHVAHARQELDGTPVASTVVTILEAFRAELASDTSDRRVWFED
jgi:hypothetical protein